MGRKVLNCTLLHDSNDIHLIIEYFGLAKELVLPRWFSGKEFACQCRKKRKHEFSPWVGKILEEEIATHSSSCLENSMDKGPSRLQAMELQRVRFD